MHSGAERGHLEENAMKTCFSAVIFDLDGTLVDSSAVIRKVMEAWCLANDVPLNEVLALCHGGRTEDTVAAVAPHLCARSEAARIEQLESGTLDGMLPIPGADRLLRELACHAWAIVTSSSMAAARAKLEVCSMPVPAVFVAAESVVHGKPHPQPFLVAAEALGVSPGKCLVFEDADNGVNAALAAGCRVVVIGDACRMEHPHIIARIASFSDTTVTPSGNLRIGTLVVEFEEPAIRR